jgi:YaiO family outer membrane protein
VRFALSLLLCCALGVAPAMAQDTVIERARSAPRAEGITILANHLATTPNDVDARLVYGLMLSWDGRYDEARRELTQVLTQAPGYLDAQVALMNVELWSDHRDAARTLVNAVLEKDAGNTQARRAQQLLDAKTRPWSAGVGYTRDTFGEDRAPWDETSVTLGRETPAGSLLVRGSQADRFGLRDRQYELEFYPSIRPGTYGFVGIGAGDTKDLYPSHRVSVDLYQTLGHGFEASAGFRRLQFSTTTDIYVGTFSKYAGNWLLTGKVFHVPDSTLGSTQSYHAQARRCFGVEGTSFIGIGYSHGFSREEPRGSGDLLRLNADTVRGQLQADVSPFMRLSASFSYSRQQRSSQTALRQNTLGAGITFRF